MNINEFLNGNNLFFAASTTALGMTAAVGNTFSFKKICAVAIGVFALSGTYLPQTCQAVSASPIPECFDGGCPPPAPLPEVIYEISDDQKENRHLPSLLKRRAGAAVDRRLAVALESKFGEKIRKDLKPGAAAACTHVTDDGVGDLVNLMKFKSIIFPIFGDRVNFNAVVAEYKVKQRGGKPRNVDLRNSMRGNPNLENIVMTNDFNYDREFKEFERRVKAAQTVFLISTPNLEKWMRERGKEPHYLYEMLVIPRGEVIPGGVMGLKSEMSGVMGLQPENAGVWFEQPMTPEHYLVQASSSLKDKMGCPQDVEELNSWYQESILSSTMLRPLLKDQSPLQKAA